jgi:UDP-glucuronate 4-epimerase
MDTVLVTGAAGFIGFHSARRLLGDGWRVIGVDNLNPYYDPRLKKARLAELSASTHFQFEELDLADRAATAELFAKNKIDYVLHLAAQAGVRHAIIDPHSYADANLVGFLDVLEGCRHSGCKHLLYASSSSVYGGNLRLPWRSDQAADHPLNLYGATKRANELMAHSYSHLFGLPTTGLRFFTVYGPWGRPDMAIWLFTEAIMDGKPIKLFNRGNMRRDFTYIDDVTEAIARLLAKPASPNLKWTGNAPDPASSAAPWRIYNIGNSRAEELRDVVSLIELEVGRAAIRELLPMQPGDIPETCADTSDLATAVGFQPRTSIGDGIHRFVDWYRTYREALGILDPKGKPENMTL